MHPLNNWYLVDNASSFILRSWAAIFYPNSGLGRARGLSVRYVEAIIGNCRFFDALLLAIHPLNGPDSLLKSDKRTKRKKAGDA